MNRKCKITIQDEVNCVISNLHPDHIGYFYEEYGLFAPNHFFNPKFKLGSWSGKIHYFHKTGKTYVNLLKDIVPRLVGLGYQIEVDDRRTSDPIFPKAIDDTFFATRGIVDYESGEPWKMRDYQVEMINAMISNGGGLGICGTGGGKANSVNSNVLTTEGWVRMGDITLNHKVITPDGDTAPVVGIFPQKSTVAYRVKFHDGSSVIASPDHLWKVKRPEHTYRANTIWDVVDTQYMIDFLDRKSSELHTPGNISIPLTTPVHFQHTAPDLTIDPYVLGVLIGDGSLTQRSIRFCSVDQEIVQRVRTAVGNIGYKLTECTYSVHKQQMDWAIVTTPQTRYDVSIPAINNLLEDLALYGCKSNSKFIPTEYLTASVDQRFELIRGLMDTDGTVGTNGSCSYTTISRQLAKDVQQLIWSLGGTCTIRSNTTLPTYTYNGEKLTGQKAYHCVIGFPDTRKLFHLTRKKERCGVHGDGRIELMRRVKTITRIDDEPMQCIMVDHPDHLYITDDYIVTHNTSVCAALAILYEEEADLKSIIIVPDKNLTVQTHLEYQFFGLDVGQYSGETKDLDHKHIVSTWQSLQNNPTILHDFDMIIVDEAHGCKGAVLSKLMNEVGKDISIRFGVTGTLPKAETDLMAVHIALGQVQYTIPAHVLMDQGHLASLHIDMVQLTVDFDQKYQQYLEEHTQADIPEKPLTPLKFKNEYFPDYTAEKQFSQTEASRLECIATMISQKRNDNKGNVLCLVDGVRFGKKLAGMIDGAVFLSGKDKMKDRREIYDQFADNDNLVVVATIQIASTGLNIKRIYNMVFIDVGKSFIRVIQSIGRGLRKAPDKDHVDVMDIHTDLKYGKRHAAERVKYYKEAKYQFTKRTVKYSDISSVDDIIS